MTSDGVAIDAERATGVVLRAALRTDHPGAQHLRRAAQNAPAAYRVALRGATRAAHVASPGNAVLSRTWRSRGVASARSSPSSSATLSASRARRAARPRGRRRRSSRPYHDRSRRARAPGGTVEKFIGDAVMALFGAPIAHEDDPERAVRRRSPSATSCSSEGLELRVGITTGEALVSLGASPSEARMASGDVVNTAARLRAPLPSTVSSWTRRPNARRAARSPTTSHRAVAAKGKAEPIAIWVAAEPARASASTPTHHGPPSSSSAASASVGSCASPRARVPTSDSPQLVTLVAVPGIGKSRLLARAPAHRRRRPGAHHLAPGPLPRLRDGITFWALGEVVKAQAGILETDDSEAEAGEKLRTAVDAIVDNERDAPLGRVAPTPPRRPRGGYRSRWRPARPRPSPPGGGSSRRSPSSGRSCSSSRTCTGPTTAQLDFVDELVDWLSGVPLLVVCTARPELLERRPGWGGGQVNASTIGLAPLSSVQTALLISPVLERSLLPAEIQQTLLERSEGNPLYAEQFAQLYLERGSADDLPLPETFQGIIAARLDGLSADEKALLQVASVLGKVFWTGALRRDEAPPRAPPRPRAQGLPHPPAPLLGRKRRRVGVRPHAPARRRLRPDPAGRSRDEAPPGGGVDREARSPRRPRRAPRLPPGAALELARAAGRIRRARDASAPRVPRGRRPRLRRQRVPRRGCVLRRRARPLAGGRRRAAGAGVSPRRRALRRRR